MLRSLRLLGLTRCSLRQLIELRFVIVHRDAFIVKMKRSPAISKAIGGELTSLTDVLANT